MPRPIPRAFTATTRPCASQRVAPITPPTAPRRISQKPAQQSSTPTPKPPQSPKAKTLSPAEQAIKDARRQFKSMGWHSSWGGFNARRAAWEKLGPPPLSEYRLTFGKHCGKRLDEVPEVYLVKYLIPRRRETGGLGNECPIVVDAIEDYMRRHPEVKGRGWRTKEKEEGDKGGALG